VTVVLCSRIHEFLEKPFFKKCIFSFSFSCYLDSHVSRATVILGIDVFDDDDDV
jgi:hypothetical protein